MGAAIIFVRVWTSSAQLCLPAEAVSYLCWAHPAQLPPQQCNIPILDQSEPCKNLPSTHSQAPLLEPQAVQAPPGLKVFGDRVSLRCCIQSKWGYLLALVEGWGLSIFRVSLIQKVFLCVWGPVESCNCIAYVFILPSHSYKRSAVQMRQLNPC